MLGGGIQLLLPAERYVSNLVFYTQSTSTVISRWRGGESTEGQWWARPTGTLGTFIHAGNEEIHVTQRTQVTKI